MAPNHRILAAILASAVVVAGPPIPASAGDNGALEGRLVVGDGTFAAGNVMLLLDRSGDLVARTGVAENGAYRFASLAPGSYRLAVEDAAGRLAPVLGPGAEVRSGSTAQRVVKLVRDSGDGRLAPALIGPKSDSWWARQTRNQKIFALVGLVVGAGVIFTAVDAVTDDETPASPSK